MRRIAQVCAGLVSVLLASSAYAQEARTLGNRPVMVGDVAHRTSSMSMDVDATMTIENVTTTPMAMKMHVGEQIETRVEVLRTVEDHKGALYRLTVVHKQSSVPMQEPVMSPLEGRVYLVDLGKRSVKADGGPKASKDVVTEVLALIDELGDPFNVGMVIEPGQRGRTLAVGDRMASGALSAAGEVGEAHVDVVAFVPGPHGDRVMLSAGGAGQLSVSEGVPMDLTVTGSGQVDLTTGWSLGMKMLGNIAVKDAPIPTDGMSMRMSMSGPVTMSMVADYTTADGQSFGYVAE